MATRTDPHFKTQADGTKLPEAEDAPRPRFEDRVEFEDLGKYEEITLPPQQRVKWMSAKLPSASPELLQDTVPPNGGVKAPPKPVPEAKAEPTSAAAALTATINHEPKPAAPSFDLLRNQETLLIPRVRRKRRLRGIVLAALGGAVALTAAGVIAHWLAADGREQPAPVATQPPGVVPTSVVAQPAPLTKPSEPVPGPTAAPEAPNAVPEPRDKPKATTKPEPSAGEEHTGHAPKPVVPTPPTGRPPASEFDKSKPWED